MIALWAVATSPGTACRGLDDTAEAQQHAERGLRSLQSGDLGAAEIELRQAVKLAPRDPTYLGSLGAVLGMEEKLEESNTYLEKALSINPSDVASRRNLASNQFQLGLLQPAKANLAKILKARPADSTGVLLLGMVNEELRDYADAVRLLTSVPDEVRKRPKSIAALARAYYNINQKVKARQALRELEGHPAGAEGIFLGGQVAAQAGDYETAEWMFASIQSNFPDPAKLGYQLALAQYRAGRIDESLSTLRKLTDAGHESSDIENLLGWCFFRQRDLKNTLAAMDKAISLDPGNESNYLDVGMILIDAQRPSGALLAAEKAIQVAPRSYRGYRLKGLAQTRLAKISDAEQAYGRAVELNPHDEQSILGLASAQWDDGKAQEAEDTFKKAFELLPRDPTLYLEYGTMLLKVAATDDPGAESRGVSALQTALALNPSLAEAHRQLGNLALAQGRNEDALQRLELAAKLEPASDRIHYSVGRAYQRLGRSEDAAKEFQIYQRLKAQRDQGTLETSAGGMRPATLPSKALVPSRLSQDSAQNQQSSARHALQ